MTSVLGRGGAPEICGNSLHTGLQAAGPGLLGTVPSPVSMQIPIANAQKLSHISFCGCHIQEYVSGRFTSLNSHL